MKKIYRNLLISIILLISFIGIFILSTIENNSTIASINTPIKDRLELIKEKGVLTVASSNDPPTAFIDPQTKQFSGIDAEIITEIAKRLGINKVEMVQLPFKDLLTELNSNNNIDMITDGMFITDERKKQAIFTNPWYTTPECIVIPKFSTIVKKEDLKNAIIGAQKGTVYAELGEIWKKDGAIKDIKTFDRIDDILFAVNNNTIDAGLMDCILIKYRLSTNSNLYLKVLSPYEHVFIGSVAASARKSDTTLIDAVNEKLTEMDNDGTLFRILEKHRLKPYT